MKILFRISIIGCFLILGPPFSGGAGAAEGVQLNSKPIKAGALDSLFRFLKNATTETEGRTIENQIWLAWRGQASLRIQDLMKQAEKKRSGYDFEGARVILNAVVTKAPDYAEGWNQRAFVLFLQEKYEDALSDIERALELEPRHFGAMAGQAQILLGQGRIKAGQKILREAVKIHPFLKERRMIIPSKEIDL